MERPPATILVLDDDPVFLTVVGDFLSERGHEVVRCADAACAGRALSAGRIDLALVDVYLPDGDGLSVCRAVRAAAPDAPVLLMTARPEGFALSDGAGALADDFFVKTNDLEELGRRVAARLEQAASLRSVRHRERMLAHVVAIARAISPYHDLATLLRVLGPQLLALPGVHGVRLDLAPPSSPGRTLGPARSGLETVLEIGAEIPTDPAAGQSVDGDRLEVLSMGHGGGRAWGRGGRLALRMQGDGALDPDVLDTLGGLLWPAFTGARLFETLKERQVRLERGYVERQRQLARLGARLDRLTDARDSFLALLSHDLRSPISVVLGHCQLIEEGLVQPAQLPRAVDTIRRQAERMSRMVEDLLDRYRQGQAGTGSAELGDLGRIAAEMVATFEPVAARRGQRLLVLAPDAAPVEADLAGIREVLANLLENALRHSPDGSTVAVDVEPSSGMVVVRVRDEGPGFAQANERGAGEGLGLRACARIVAAAGGTLRTGNLPGKGGVATFTVPLALPRCEAPAVRILAGDVDRVEQLQEALGRHWDTVGATDVESALPQMRRHPPSAIVVDASLEAEGLEAVAVLKADAEVAGVPVIAIGPAGDASWVERAHDLGALVTLAHPLDVEALLAEVRRAVRMVEGARTTVAGRAPDALTGLDTADFLQARLPALAADCRLAGRPLPMVRVDVVDLKQVNRTHGWVVGDQLLVWLAGLLRDRARPGDICGRVEDDAFALVSPGRTMEEAEQLCGDLRESVNRAKPRLGVARVSVQVTAHAVDVACLPADRESLLAALRGGKDA